MLLVKAVTNVHVRSMKAQRIRRFPRRIHVREDFCHRYPKLKVPLDEPPKAKKISSNCVSPGRLYHGIQPTDITANLNKPPPYHCSVDVETPTEWFGLKCCDITKIPHRASKGPMPPSRDYYFGVQGTDVTQNSRTVRAFVYPANDEEPRAFFGRPKSDITDFNLLPDKILDGECREGTLQMSAWKGPAGFHHLQSADCLGIRTPDSALE